jgi:glycosyltransferase involved in cell wall biosynthesis
MRLAWFSPWPPERSGIAGRSAELVPRLASRGHAIDVFVDERRVPVTRADDGAPRAGEVRVQSAHDFVWRMARRQYDLVVYQLGNSRLHEFIWPYLFRWPGLAVLHDARLHHARGRALLLQKRFDDYRAEFTWNEPRVSVEAAELAIAGFDGIYYYQWPMTRSVVESSLLTAAHSRGTVSELTEAWPDRPIDYIALGEGRAELPADAARRATRASLGWTDATVAFGVFGAQTAEKRLLPIVRALASAHARNPEARLLLAGSRDRSIDAAALATEFGLADAVTIRDAPGAVEFDDLIAAVDVSLNLRWPTALETSGPWLRALAAARPTVIVDLAHLAEVPTLDPRTWQLHGPRSAARGPGPREPVAIAIDILDEDHSLRLAMSRLAVDADLRSTLGRAGRAYWEVEHTVTRMADDYERVMARAAQLAPPTGPRPGHLRPNPSGRRDAILKEVDPALVATLGSER